MYLVFAVQTAQFCWFIIEASKSILNIVSYHVLLVWANCAAGTDTKIREHTRMKRSVRQLFIVKMLLKRLKILYTSNTATYKL